MYELPSYFVEVRFGFAGKWREYKDWLKAVPGVKADFGPDKKFRCWLVPSEVIDLAQKKAAEMGVKIKC